MQRVLSPVRVYSTRAIPNTVPVEQVLVASPRRSVTRVEYASSPVRQVVLNDVHAVRHIPSRVISDQPITRARSIGSTAGLRKSSYVVRDALPTTSVIGQPVEIIELPASEIRPTYVRHISPERVLTSETYVPISYVASEPVRRVALSPLRSSYIDYTTPGVSIRSTRPGEIRRVGSTIEAPISSYRRALSPVAESQYHRDIARLFADIKQPRSAYLDDIGRLFGSYATSTRSNNIHSTRVGELFNRSLLSSELDDRLKFDVDSAVRRILEKTKI